ncbi:GNAT family N-acetyltransferase [Bombilactobacillus bombi]|uniref:GNAT family N-acetyltransferase n=1 Tax=Bombilactobacillus bombi TaxID=1303590 RepID=UPI0015E5ABCC|nr:GNAT family N-acetyltransferase [Bombilactobacillus bombi]
MIRQAQSKDAPVVFDLLQQIFNDMEIAIMKKHPQQIRCLLEDAFDSPYSRYNFHNAIVYEYHQQVVGVLVGYFAAEEQANSNYYYQQASQYGFGSDFELFFNQETYPNEWYLDSLAVNPDFQGKQIGTRLIKAIPRFFPASLISLNVDVDNPRALKLYHSLGFNAVGQLTIGHHHYHHMQKLVQ